MNDFLTFIEKDIATKKLTIQTLPIKTKTNIKKLNETIKIYEDKYEEYRAGVRNYLLAKSRSFELTNEDNSLLVNQVNEKVIVLERVKFLLNPLNTYVEKMGFDVLIYQLNNYYAFNFNSLNDIINSFLDKFELAGIKLSKNDFMYTCYVNEYMSAFLDVRYSALKKYDNLSEIFEKIYWVNPDIVKHIELNFRKLIHSYAKTFDAYILKIQTEALQANNIVNYEDCLSKLKDAHVELKNISDETVVDIIKKAKNNEFNINHYLENNKIRVGAYNSLIPNSVDLNDNSLYQNLDKFKNNILEYQNYLKFLPIFNLFKEEFESFLSKDIKDYKELNQIKDSIEQKEKELVKINNRIFGGKFSFLDFKREKNVKLLKTESIALTKELYELYKLYDEKYFISKVLRNLNKNITISDVMMLYYSFDYFKKSAIQKAYEINSYDEIMEYSNSFDLFAIDSTNVIITGIPVFEEANMPMVIANKYRLCNINVNENDLEEENLNSLLNKITLILRINKIEQSSSSVEKIWFMTSVEKMISKESDNTNN